MDNNILKSFTIDELVNELATREGVEIDRLRSDVGMDLEVEGPAIVIVIDKEGEDYGEV
ncbi:BC1881 family protein [Intestinibacter bartlettii]|uniref:BC1881 family protein n=1 Tax=Intestinibacter bartlettii TaxID=261299 RepID=UPI0024332B23|nr:BC1881 family protein [Intestinibacter bartlettii]